jgi:hypothetical protein
MAAWKELFSITCVRATATESSTLTVTCLWGSACSNHAHLCSRDRVGELDSIESLGSVGLGGEAEAQRRGERRGAAGRGKGGSVR